MVEFFATYMIRRRRVGGSSQELGQLRYMADYFACTKLTHLDRRSNVAQPAITRTMIVPHIVFTMLATG
jgi:hypothetical protein